MRTPKVRELKNRRWPALMGLRGRAYTAAYRRLTRWKRHRQQCDCGQPVLLKNSAGEDVCLRCKTMEETRKFLNRVDAVVEKHRAVVRNERPMSGAFYSPPKVRTTFGYGPLLVLEERLKAL